MRVALILLLAVAACGTPDAEDRPDPVLPATGWWSIVENDFAHIECETTYNFPGTSFFLDLWTYSPEDRLLVSWGAFGEWTHLNVRCPVNVHGRFVCEPQFESRESSVVERTDYSRIEVSGGNSGGESLMALQYDIYRSCEGPDCQLTRPCHMRETATLEYRGNIRQR